MAPKRIHTDPKTCLQCSKEFNRPPRLGIKLWEARLLCGMGCSREWGKTHGMGFQKGHGPFQGTEDSQFKKGRATWNKGVHVKFNDALNVFRKNGGSSMRGHVFSEEHKRKIREARARQIIPKGKDHWNWKGGVSPLRKEIQRLRLYYDWRFQVFKRDNFTCQICGVRGVYLHADHIYAFSAILRDFGIKTVDDAQNCSKLWDISNGRTLCVKCHTESDTFGSKSVKR